MLDLQTTTRIQQASIAERIQIIEFILESLKSEIQSHSVEPVIERTPFKVRCFSLGQNVEVDRETMYLERGL